jgi:MFS family permease
MATGPAWNTWVGRLVPRRLRARFFARRTRLAQAGALAGLLGGGLLLHGADDKREALPRFAALFLLAAAARACSSRMLSRQSEPRSPLARERGVPLALLLRRLLHPRGDRLLVYLLGIQVSVQLAGRTSPRTCSSSCGCPTRATSR